MSSDNPPPSHTHTHFDHVYGYNWEFYSILDSKSKVHSLPIDFHPLFENYTLPDAKASIILFW